MNQFNRTTCDSYINFDADKELSQKNRTWEPWNRMNQSLQTRTSKSRYPKKFESKRNSYQRPIKDHYSVMKYGAIREYLENCSLSPLQEPSLIQPPTWKSGPRKYKKFIEPNALISKPISTETEDYTIAAPINIGGITFRNKHIPHEYFPRRTFCETSSNTCRGPYELAEYEAVSNPVEQVTKLTPRIKTRGKPSTSIYESTRTSFMIRSTAKSI